MKPSLEHVLRTARVHDLAHREARRLRREAIGAAFTALVGWLGALPLRVRRSQWRRHAVPTGAR